jgi:hypothetical protein
MVNDVEKIFMHLLAIYTSSFGTVQFICPFIAWITYYFGV